MMSLAFNRTAAFDIECAQHPSMYSVLMQGKKVVVQFSSVHFDLITQEMLNLQLIGGFHAGPGPH